MIDHKTGTREEWLAARLELLKPLAAALIDSFSEPRSS